LSGTGSKATGIGSGGGGDARRPAHAVSGGSDGTLRVWDLSSGASIAALTGDQSMNAVAAASDQLFVARDAGGVVHIAELIGP
jgi:WD40 repeat protein